MAESFVGRRVTVRTVEPYTLIAAGLAIADGPAGVLVREDNGSQAWWPPHMVEPVELDLRAVDRG